MEQNNIITEQEREIILNDTNALFIKMLEKDRYDELLKLFGENGKYSLVNILYLKSQNSDFKLGKNMNEWNRLNREVIPNSKSLKVMTPTKEKEEIDGIDKNGNSFKKISSKLNGFHTSYIFDISATKGAEYKPYKIEEKISDEDKGNFLTGISEALNRKKIKFKFVDKEQFKDDETCRVCPSDRIIEVRKGMSNYHTVLGLLDASCIALINSNKNDKFVGLRGEKADYLEIKSMQCILASHYGLDTSYYTFPEIKEMDSKDKIAFRDNVGVVCSATKSLIDRIDYAFLQSSTKKEEKKEVVTTTTSSFLKTPKFQSNEAY